MKDRYELSIYSSTVLKKDRDSKKLTGKLSTLDYLLKFLDAYDFSSDSAGDIQEENKNLINASVLGLIFEKINGYKEGSFYTPGFITMYMSREVIRKAVLQKCNEKLDKNYTDFEELKNNIEYSSPEVRDKINKITNDIKICDPAVGSGHFLVSSLNEILSIKSELGILTYLDGSRVHDYKIITENDELIITNVETEELFDYHLNDKGNPIESLQRLQELLFEEKRKIIENCLFGVDINPNSVNICRLRLWIELLKSSFYTKESGYKELETLPNIDINIKQGNSLISKFELDADISSILKTAKWKFEDYKRLVAEYKDSDDKESKRAISKLIDDIKEKISEQLSSTHPLNIKLKKLRKEYYTKFDTIDAFEDDLSDKQKAKKQKEKNKLESKLNSVTKDILEFEEGKLYREAFEWRFEFPEVLDENGKFLGFDVVIGNPPYIGEKDNSNLFEQLKNLLIWTSIYRRRSNTYYFFIKLSGLLLKKSGWMSQIIPREFLTADWADKIRSYFLTDLNPTNLLDFKATKVFEDVGTTSLIVLAEKNQLNTDIRYVIPSAYKLSSGKKLIEYSESKIISKDTIDFSGSSELIPTTTISQNSNNTIDLDELFNVTQGIVTGADKVTKSHIEKGFIQESYYSRGIYVLTSQVDIRVDENDNYQLKINDSWVSLDDNEKTYIKKFVYSNQINEWSIDDSTEYVIYFGNNTKPFNSIYEYLLQFSTILLNRSKANYDEVISLEEFNTFTEADIKSIYSSAGAVQKIMRKGDWFKPLYERTKFNFAEPKILVNTKNIFPFSLSTEEIVSSGGGLGGQNILFLKESNYLNLIKKYSSEIDFLKFVNSFLNSSLNKFKLIRSDYNQLSTSKIKNIKLFRISWDNQEEVNKYKKVVRLSDELIKCENDNTQGYEKIKKEVDKVFYDLYGLSKKEIQSIEEFFE